MIRSTESLTSTTELDVSAYSKVLLQPETACNAVVQGSTTTSGNLWDVVPVKVYASGVESLGNGGPVLANNIVEVPCEGLARIKVSGLAASTTVRVTRVIHAEGPVSKWVAVTPDDATDFADGLCRCFYVGVAGDLEITDGDGNIVNFANCPVGIMPAMGIRLNENTTAGSILAGY